MIAAGFVVCAMMLKRVKLKNNDRDQPCRQRSSRRRPMLEQKAGTNVFPVQSQHGCGRNKSEQPTETRRGKADVLITHHLFTEARQTFWPDIFPI